MASEAVKGLSPAPLWEFFDRIAGIPRPSKKEEKVASYIMNLAREHRLEVERDASGNVLVRKPASSGRSGAPSVSLQSHLDMVCEKNNDVIHDFDTGGIILQQADGWISARGTTLGSDNGIGVAAALSVMTDASIAHGPLELLFTVDEETGLTGARGLRPGFLKSRTLLNLDSEEDGAVYVGCSGGRDTLLTLPVKTEKVPPGFSPVTLVIDGLRGGHSGLDIGTGRANAIRLLARMLLDISESPDVRIGSLKGGNKRNAIPREAEALLYVREKKTEDLHEQVRRLQEVVKAEYAITEPLLAARVLPVTASSGSTVLSREDHMKLVHLLVALPLGVVSMSADITGLVETSTNVATVETTGDAVLNGSSQ